MASIFPLPLIPLSGVLTVSPTNYQAVSPGFYTGLQARFFHTTILDADLTNLTAAGSLNEYLNLEFITDPLARSLLPGDFIWVQYGPQTTLSLMQVVRSLPLGVESYTLVKVTIT
jgi:hypothetical protein